MNLLRYNKTQKFCLFDFETSHLSLVLDNKPWQLSWVIIEGDRIIDEKDYYPWWPDLKISDDAARITRFDYNVYKERATDPNKILEEFDSIIYNPDYLLLGHNIINFDLYIHNQYRKLMGKNTDYSYIDRTIDTNCLAKMIKLGISSCEMANLSENMLKFSNYVQKGLKTSLGLLAKENDIPTDESKLHDGIYDCKINASVWNKLKWQIEI